MEDGANHSKLHKVLILLPNTNDRSEGDKLDRGKYEVHFLHASDDVKDKAMPTFAYAEFLSQPGFLLSYVDRAVDYVKENDITGIMFGYDMSSVVASVVCERTGLPGPSLEATFRCLHKYYSRKTAEGKLWVDYINLDDTVENWRDKVSYPCFLKTPFLAASKGCSCIRSEAVLVDALAKLKPLLSPFFKGYSEFFTKYLDLEKFPLAVENIVVLEELVESGKEYSGEGWMDGDGKFTMFTTWEIPVSPKKLETILAFVQPLFSLDDASLQECIKFTEEIGHKFGLRNTFYNIEVWKHGDKFTLIEVNSRGTTQLSECHKKTYGISVYEAAVRLACGEIDALRATKTSFVHKDGEPIAGILQVNTWGEGKATDFLDFDYARTGSISDGVFNNAGPGATLHVAEDSQVKQTSTNGFNLCGFFIVDDNVSRFFERAKKIADKLLLRQEDRDVIEFATIDN